MYNQRDLRLFSYNDSLLQLMGRLPRTSLLNILTSWFESSQLRPTRPGSDLSEYTATDPNVSKPKMIELISKRDWPRGLSACQIAQLYYDRTLRLRRLFWRVIKLSNDEEPVKLHLDIQTIREEIEQYMNTFFYCYVYPFHNQETDTYMFIMSISPDSHENDEDLAHSKQLFSYMIYFPETEYVVTPKYIWTTEYDKFFKEALISTFGANKLLSETAYVESVAQLKKKFDTVNSTGILAQLRNNQLDTTPLDIRQKRPREFDQFYVDGGEQRKRIVPIDMEELKARYQAIEDNFGWDEVEGSRQLEVELELPLHTAEEDTLYEYDDDFVEISMLIEGNNVAEGVRKSIIAGKIDAPAPLWLEAVAVTGYEKIKVHPDGTVEDLKAQPVEETPTDLGLFNIA